MKRLVLAALALLALRADMYPDAGNAKLPQARANFGGGRPVSITDHGGKGDAIIWPDGTMAAGSATLTSVSASFSQADVGKLIQVDGALGVWQPPLMTTISTVTNANTITLVNPATTATPHRYLGAATVATPRTTGNYQPGDVLAITGGTGTAASVKVTTTQVTASTIVAGGSGGTDGACIVEGTTGTGTKVKLNTTISGGAITAIVGAITNGHYFTNPTNPAAEPIANAPGSGCAPSGATLNLSMGVEIVAVATKGDYSAVPLSPIATGPGSISGATGATLTGNSWNHTGAFIYGTDDSQPLKNAIDAAQAMYNDGKGRSSYVFIPAGTYLIDATPTPLMWSGLGIIGEGSFKSTLIMGANYAGDLFQWDEAWGAANGVPYAEINGTMGRTSDLRSGAKVIGLSIWGNRAAPAQQNAIVFYDRADQVEIDDVDINYINGRCLYSGVLKNITEAAMRESRIGRLRCYVSGAPGIPSIEFSSQGSADATNEININEIDVYANYGDGVVFRSNNAPNALRNIRINKLRIEGQQWGDVGGDLLRIGDPVMVGGVNDIYINQLELLSPYPGKAALKITAPNANAQPYFIRIESGAIGGLPLGYGIVLEWGRNLYLGFHDIYSWNTNFTMASGVGYTVLDGGGREAGWTYSLPNPSWLQTVIRKSGHPAPVVTGSHPASMPVTQDFTAIGGNLRGSGAVDWQSVRNTAGQIASGDRSIIGGGSGNTASGYLSTVGGGILNSATGFGTSIPGGGRTLDRGLDGGIYYASYGCATFDIPGACQRSWHTLGKVANTAAAVRLTSSQGAPSATNCVNIPAGTAYQVVVRASAHNRTTHAAASWDAIQGLLHRGTGATAYLGGAGGAATQSTAAMGTLGVAADAANNCLALTYTPPAGNTDYIDVTATVDVTEVQ